MKKFLCLLICICSLYFCWSVAPVVFSAESRGNAGKISSDTDAKRFDSLFWSIIPDKKDWPKPVLMVWKATHMKENALSKVPEENWVKLKDMPKHLPQALIAVEDRHFYEHNGIDIDGILRAILVNIQNERIVQGGSTITQQLVKNTVLDSEQTLERKIMEAFLALFVESKYSKDEILEMYLNTTYFGAGATGVHDAAYTYFGSQPFQLSLEECATLAALPNAPTALNPYENKAGCKKRRDLVLSLMVKYNYVTMEEAKLAADKPISLSGNTGNSL